MPNTQPLIKSLGLQDYESTWKAMKDFTHTRTPDTPDEIWLLEHPPVYTQGQQGKAEHILSPGDIPIVQSDRGGQVTYHGPGQLIAYLLIDIRRRDMGVRQLVSAIEQGIIEYLKTYNIKSESRCKAPGVYIGNAKIASLGLRVRKGCSYHGLSFNVDMDLEPFLRINPCGLKDISVTQLRDHGGPSDLKAVSDELIPHLLTKLRYNS